MRAFDYRRGYNARQAAISGLASMAMLTLAVTQHKYLIGIAGLAGLAVAGAAAMRAISSGPALVIRDSGVEVGGPLGSRILPWTDIDDVVLMNRGASMIMGMFIGGTLALCFQTKDTPINRNRIMLPVAAIDLPTGGAPALLEMLNQSLSQFRDGGAIGALSNETDGSQGISQAT